MSLEIGDRVIAIPEYRSKYKNKIGILKFINLNDTLPYSISFTDGFRMCYKDKELIKVNKLTEVLYL